MSTSILSDTKRVLGLDEEYTPFDAELILHINAVLADMHQLGFGPEGGYEITSKTDTWTPLTSDDPRYNSVKSLVYLKVRMLYDPPTLGYVVTAYEKMIEKAEWRVNVAREDIVHPTPPPPDIVLSGDPFETGRIEP